MASSSRTRWTGRRSPRTRSRPVETFLYKFKVSRPGIYWYHPHHHSSTNQVFKGLYGLILVTDPERGRAVAAARCPSAAQTRARSCSATLTVCKAPRAAATRPRRYPATRRRAVAVDRAGGPLPPSRPAPTPIDALRDRPDRRERRDLPAGTTVRRRETSRTSRSTTGRTNEGQTVLTNGMNVGGRAGSPDAPGALVGCADTRRPGRQGLRLQIVNAATTRYMRLRLTDERRGDTIDSARARRRRGRTARRRRRRGQASPQPAPSTRSTTAARSCSRPAPAPTSSPRSRPVGDRRADALDRGLPAHGGGQGIRTGGPYADRPGHAPERHRARAGAVHDRRRHPTAALGAPAIAVESLGAPTGGAARPGDVLADEARPEPGRTIRRSSSGMAGPARSGSTALRNT